MQTILDEEVNAGYREIDFEAANFTGRIYFYQFSAVNYKETKKMILVKENRIINFTEQSEK